MSMDVQKTMEFLLEHQARVDARIEAHHAKMETEFAVIQANLNEASRLHREAAARADRTDARLSRAIRLSIKEARDERSRRRKGLDEIDEKITQLAASHLMTEEVLRDFIASLKGKGGNGHNS